MHKNRRMRHFARRIGLRLAVTMPEMLVAMAIMAMVFAVVLPQFYNIRSSWDSREAAAETLQNGRVLTEHLSDNLAKAVRIIAVSASAETDGYIEFEDNDARVLRYDIANNYVEYGVVGSLADLAGPVSTLQFTCYALDDLDTPITEPNDIRLVRVESALTNSAPLGQDKTLSTYVHIRANADSETEITQGLVGWWKLDETSGLTAADSSGSSNDGTLGNMTGNEWTTGPADGALEFDGSNDHIAGIGNCPTGNYTIAGWAKDTGGSGWKVFYSAEQEIWLGVNSGASAAIWLDCGGNGKGANTAAGTWSQDTWHHIAATWDGTDIHIYLDGVDMSITVYGAPENPQAKAAVIGAWSENHTDENWSGTFDDIRLYDRALNGEELSQLASGSGSSSVSYTEFTEAKANSNVQAITIDTPAGTTEGDLLIAAVVTDAKETVSPPGGENWTEIDQDDGSNAVTLGVWWKLAEASESGSHQFTWGSSEECYAFMMRFTGHDATDPINDSLGQGGSNTSSPPSPAVTTTVADCLVLRIGGFDDDDISINNPGLSGHTAITMDESGSGSGTCSGGAGYVLQSAIGGSGTSSFSLTGGEQYRTVTIAIAPDPSAGGGSGEIRP